MTASFWVGEGVLKDDERWRGGCPKTKDNLILNHPSRVKKMFGVILFFLSKKQKKIETRANRKKGVKKKLQDKIMINFLKKMTKWRGEGGGSKEDVGGR